MFEAGSGTADITQFTKGIGMMGYGMHFNIVEEIETPLSARAFVIRDSETKKKIVFVNAEIAFITIAIKKEVVKRLHANYPHFGYTDENVILTAQHTHSAPGGYSHYPFYNFSIPGFVPAVFEKITGGIIEAIKHAESDIKPAALYLNTGAFEADQEVAFNRSLPAYNANPEVQKVAEGKTHLAVDREMTLLRIDSPDGIQRAMINWFGVHTTSIPNTNKKICYDNKGYAASYFEKHIRNTTGLNGFTAAFAQGVSGDVSPNFIWDSKKKVMRGKYADPFESARFNGNLQYLKALEIYETALKQSPLKGEIDHVLMYVDFSSVQPDKEFTNGQEVHTGPACHGIAFFRGTAEGPGMPPALGSVALFLSRTVKKYELLKARFASAEERNNILTKYRIQGKKDIMLEAGAGKILGASNMSRLIVPSIADKSIATVKKQYKNGSLRTPWIPQVLPLQLIIIGELAIAGFPGEITTIAGKRLKETLLSVLEKRGIKKVVISSYANAYCGYVTTYEEYQCQLYEGGHTVYGEWTLAAFQTEFKKLALQLLEKPENRKLDTGVKPLEFTKEELSKRTYEP
ncbi:MAG: neutral/alkaline non-lysosomal ceramidase N-terminal domain-containing protein [Bacteroidia bacterium]